MKKHLAFISSPEEIGYIQKLTLGLDKDNKNQITIICNNAETLFHLKQLNIPAIDSQKYFPRGNKLRQTGDRVINISKQWADLPPIREDITYLNYNLGKIAGYSLWLHLCECQHGLMVAANIIEQVKPDIIHISPLPTESQLKKYQSGKLNCENLALIEIARRRHITLHFIRFNPFAEFLTAARVFFLHFLRDLKCSLKPPKSPLQPGLKSKFFILANDYHLANLQPFLKYLDKNRISYDLFGKFNLPQRHIKTTPAFLLTWFKHLRTLKNFYNAADPHVWPLIKWKLFYLYTVQFPEIIETLDLADNLFKSHPRLFLTAATADIFNKCFAVSARKNKVRTIELNHGLIIYDEESAFRCNNQLAVWGPAFKSLIRKGKTIVTGHPLFDSPTSAGQINKLNISGRKKYHLGLDKKVLLVLAALPIASDRLISNKSEYSFLKTIFDSLAATKKPWTVIFRTHPSNDADWLNQIPTPPNINLITDFRHIPLNEAVSVSDLIIANLTTALIEGIIQNKPVLIYPFLDYSAIHLSSHPLITSGAVSTFQTPRELTQFLTGAIPTDSKQRVKNLKFLKEYCSFPAKVSASQKIYNIIQKELTK